jgi:hypothetical protein
MNQQQMNSSQKRKSLEEQIMIFFINTIHQAVYQVDEDQYDITLIDEFERWLDTGLMCETSLKIFNKWVKSQQDELEPEHFLAINALVKNWFVVDKDVIYEKGWVTRIDFRTNDNRIWKTGLH